MIEEFEEIEDDHFEHEGALPSEQRAIADLPKLRALVLHRRRETIFLVLSGVFLGTLAMLNILGITRFIDLGFTVPGLGWEIPMPLAVGVLPYPITFLCTDLISEFYGRRRANRVVWVGLLLNAWVMSILWLGGALPGFEGEDRSGIYFQVQELAFGAVTASMFAYMAAQLIDVQLFHFWKRLTKGKHLWLRNNGSTLVSQLVDAVAVTLVTYYLTDGLERVIDAEQPLAGQLLTLMMASYVFKMVTALLDTGPFYAAVYGLARYLRLPIASQD